MDWAKGPQVEDNDSEDLKKTRMRWDQRTCRQFGYKVPFGD